MSQQWKRNARIIVGKYGKKGVVVQNLRVSFDCEKTRESTPNQARVQIYNLTKESRALFSGDDIFLSVEAGYGTDLRLIFSGNANFVEHKRNGVDIISTVSTSDGGRDLCESTLSKSYPAGTKVKDVLKDTVGTFKNLSGKDLAIKAFESAKELVTGGTFDGKSCDILDTLIRSEGYAFSVQDNELKIHKTSDPTGKEALLLTPNTGLLDSPDKIKIEKNGKKVDGVSFRCLLNPLLNPGSIVRIKSEFIDGEFIIDKLTHQGDNFEGEWTTSCEAVVR